MNLTPEQKEILLAIAEGKQIERSHDGCNWKVMDAPWLLIDSGYWKLRVKQTTIKIGTREVPEPARKPLQNGQAYWVVSPNSHTLVHGTCIWSGDKLDFIWLNKGLIHTTKDAAVAHAKALIALSTKT